MSVRRVVSLTLTAPLLLASPALAQPGDAARDAMERLRAPQQIAAPHARPLSPAIEKGLAWLVQTQLPNGAWGQGEESAHMGSSVDVARVGSVADTGVSVLALLRGGSSAADGRHAKAVRRGIEFILVEIERSDADSMWVTRSRSTRVQAKIGPYVDTFVASMVLAEVKGRTGAPELDRRVDAALAKVLKKIEKNQRADGSWDDRGWAPALSQAVAAKGLNRAAQNGADVPEQTRRKTEAYADRQFDRAAGGFESGGSAGVGLYAAASSVSALADNVATNELGAAKLKAQAAAGPAEQQAQARELLKRNEQAKVAHQSAEQALVARLDDPHFVAGFGSNGGEEFLSYMLISESLLARGGAEWKQWNTAMQQNLARVQNGDGSWTGHHCITGRTFCTATALLVLMADRAPLPTAQQLGARG